MAAVDVAGRRGDLFVETFRTQLSELDLLQSMYPNEGELSIVNPSVVGDMNDYVDGRTSELPLSWLEYRVNLLAQSETRTTTTFEVSCRLPHGYPSTIDQLPHLYVRSQQLNRVQQHRLNEDARAMMVAADQVECCVFTVLQWVRDNGPSYLSEDTERVADIKTNEQEEQCALDRYWIYSHHIYNKTKRRNIVQWAADLDITGFCLAGKPGIICAEGTAHDCSHFWDRVRRMNWKKITCKRIEHEDGKGSLESMNDRRRFPAFSEVTFGGASVDFGAFLAYLEERKCGHVFKDYFGIDGRLQQTTTEQRH